VGAHEVSIGNDDTHSRMEALITGSYLPTMLKTLLKLQNVLGLPRTISTFITTQVWTGIDLEIRLQSHSAKEHAFA